MEILFAFAPGTISAIIYEKLSGKKMDGVTFAKHIFLDNYIINIFALLIYKYIMHGENSVALGMSAISFIIPYAGLCVIISVLVGFMSYYILNNVSISLEEKADKKKKRDKNRRNNIVK